MPPISDTEVRLTLYRQFVRTAQPPTVAQIAEQMNAAIEEVRAALERLATGRALVLQPVSREILLAQPLSAVPTPYRVTAASLAYFAPCAWDALGIMAMLKTEAILDTSCPCCGEAMKIASSSGERLDPSQGVIHFAVPARRWWENIVFT